MSSVVAGGLAVALTLNPLPTAAAIDDDGGRLIWTQTQKLVEDDRPEQNDRFGYAVAADGDTLVVGAPYDSIFGGTHTCGSVYVFMLDGGTWELQQRLLAGDPEYGAAFGFSVDISGDTIVVGSPEDSHSGHNDIGSVYVFVRSGTTWSQQQKLISSAPDDYQSFGKSVAIEGDTVVVGDPDRNIGTAWAVGSAYVYLRSGTTWSEQAVLIGDDTAEGDVFGWAVDLSGDTLVATSRYHDTGGLHNAGAAYVFTRSGTVWGQQVRLQAAVPVEDSSFGYRVSLDSDTCLVADFDDVVHAFARSGTVWGAPQELVSWLPDDGVFGASIAVRGDLAVIGAHAHSWGGVAHAGAAYVFARSGGGLWTGWYKMGCDNPTEFEWFGHTVALEGDTVFAGAPYSDHSGATDAGAAYVFDSVIVVSDLEVSNDDFQTTAVPGEPYAATVIAANFAGPDDAVGAVVTESFPSSLLGCSWICSPSGGATCSAGPVTGNINDTVDLPVGGAATYSVSCTVDPAASGTLTTTAMVTVALGWDDPVPANNSDSDSDTLTPEVDLAVGKNNGVTEIIWGDPTVYTIDIANPGPSDVAGVTVSDLFPTGLDDCSWTCAPSPGAGCTASGSGDILDTADIPAGSDVTYTATCTVVAGGGTCSNTAAATVPVGTTERDANDNNATDVDTIALPAHVIFVDGFEDGTTDFWSVVVS